MKTRAQALREDAIWHLEMAEIGFRRAREENEEENPDLYDELQVQSLLVRLKEKYGRG